MTMTNTQEVDGNLLERAVRYVARTPDRSRRLAEARKKTQGGSELELKRRAAKTIVRGHSLRSGLAGGSTGMIGAIPGVGTAVAVTAGVTTDVVLQMKVNVDMCHALVHLFKPELDDDKAFSYAVSLAYYGTLEKRGAKWLGGRGTTLASQAGVKILRQQLRGSALIATKQVFKRVGIVFTRKAVEKPSHSAWER